MRAWHLFSRRTKGAEEKWNVRTMFGENLNFAATEAYKVLRTNLKFSFPDDGRGKVIGITSSQQGEGKSSTACNIAYALAEDNVKVVLLEADLRRPSIASKLGVARKPGITNLLVNRESDDVVQQSMHAPQVDLICCGDIPPNPSELLGSARMEQLVRELTGVYDYIVVDLPPVNVVSDAIAMSKCLDGVVMVVRSGISEQRMLSEAMRQLKLVNVRILGFVFRDSAAGNGKYGNHYKKYYLIKLVLLILL